MIKYVDTNMGRMPIEDYRDMIAIQSGFNDYDEMFEAGYRIGDGMDKEENDEE